MRIRCIYIIAMLAFAVSSGAQSQAQEAKMAARLERFFAKYKPKGQELPQAPRMLGYKVDNRRRTLTITADGTFAAQEFTPKTTQSIYRKIKGELPKPYNKYKVTVVTNGMAIEELVPNRITQDTDKSRLWGDTDYDGQPWVSNVSVPLRITHGLQNRHISLWASHGRYYDRKRDKWKWQRPKLFGTTEDLFTQTIVVPYLIPMLENAGAVVFTPRERDWQKNEVIVDNDDGTRGTGYIEVNAKHEWKSTGTSGFARHAGNYRDGENPFTAGTARMARTTKKKNYSLISYQPTIPKEGRYAVYVSYKTLENSVDDACYTVWHKGEPTEFRVNQRMGGGTWVYLGTFDFDKGSSEFNRITVTNRSSRNGVVTADAVRLGGGMGNIERGGRTSGLPRCLEGARYYAQWAGMPYSVYSSKGGSDDYSDDINTRSFMTNYLGGGSCYMPSLSGGKVPIELSLAIHSDAGYAKDGLGLIGSLAICTTNFNGGRLNAGISRMASHDFADALLSNVTRDIKFKYRNWNKRNLYDRNYSETRVPEIPSAILETMSHQNFPDMRYGQDPDFKFTLARSVYKTILRYICDQHGRPYIVAPLTPENFSIEFTGKDEVRLSWNAVNDPQETTSQPTGYIVYTKYGSLGFDNGTYVRSATSYKTRLEPGVLYSFRVEAVNRGGRSFPTEVLCAEYNHGADRTVMVVDGFKRLSSPAIRDNAEEQGFDFDEDPGVTLGPTAGWAGRQICFDRSRMGIEDESGLGWSGDELTGVFVAGNDKSHVHTHAEAIHSAHGYNIVSSSKEAVETGKVNLSKYDVVDVVLGLERNDGHSLKYYKTFSTMMRNALEMYTRRGGSLLVSGAYIGTDMTSTDERKFLTDVLRLRHSAIIRNGNDSVYGMGTTIRFYNSINEEHYAATSYDALQPVAPAYAALRYTNGYDAAVAYMGSDNRSFVMGFPFECIKGRDKQAAIMKGILTYLTR